MATIAEKTVSEIIGLLLANQNFKIVRAEVQGDHLVVETSILTYTGGIIRIPLYVDIDKTLSELRK